MWTQCMCSVAQGSSLLAKQGKGGEVALVLGAGNQVLILHPWTAAQLHPALQPYIVDT